MPDPGVHDLRVIQGATWTVLFRLQLDDGSPLDTTGYGARMQVRAAAETADPELELTVSNGRLQVGYDPPPWEASTAYALGQRVTPTALNGFVYACTVAGTSGSSEPTWPTTLTGTVVDGTATWRCEAADDEVTNIRIEVDPTVTEPLESWGNGFYDIELIDPFGHVTRVLEGSCVLSREITR